MNATLFLAPFAILLGIGCTAPKTARTIVDSPRPVLAKLPNRKNMAKGFDGSRDRFAGMGLSRCANLRALDAEANAVCHSLKVTREAMEKHLPEFDGETSVLQAARSAGATIFSMSCPGGDMHAQHQAFMESVFVVEHSLDPYATELLV